MSILFATPSGVPQTEVTSSPIFFGDLNLDKFLEAVTKDFKEYNLAEFYQTPLEDLDTILFRQEVMDDLSEPSLLLAIQSFSSSLREVRAQLEQARKAYYKYAGRRSFLRAAEIYCSTIRQISSDLSLSSLSSRGFVLFRDSMAGYASSPQFMTVESDASSLGSYLSQIRYTLLLKGDRVTVRFAEEERDYSASLEETFQKFWRDSDKEFWVSLHKIDGDNHIQSQIIDGVAKLYPDTFRALEAFCADHADFLDPAISRFDREIQFYVAYLSYIDKLRAAGLHFCRPQLSRDSKEIAVSDAFDIVLANKLIDERVPVVCNDFYLSGKERIFVVSGPNHGGKTTFARVFGQAHYLASLGLPVPGTSARLFLYDRLFTHFERAESILNLRGKLQDDLVRIHSILEAATPNSLVIMNEIFSSTTLKDAVSLSRKILARISALDLLGVCVTFLDELALFNEKTVSVVSMIGPSDPTVRTFKLERRPADGLAYALAIAHKYSVTYEHLKERIPG